MTISVTCPCGGRFAAPPKLAGKNVRCPKCQQVLHVPTAAPEPLAPIVNPFSEAAVEAELVSPAPQAASPVPHSQDPFGGKATVRDAPAQPFATAHAVSDPQLQTHAQPQTYGQPLPAKYSGGSGRPARKSYALFYILGAGLFGVFCVVFLAGIAVYQFLQELEGMDFELSQPLTVQSEDYADARSRFSTNLTSRGEAPQEWEPLSVPAGAAELTYRSGGHTLRAYVSPPPANGSARPGVVFLHGGFAWGDSDWDMTRPYRDQGFVVMTPVLRGENGQPGHFSLYYDEVDDVLAATEAFADLPYVDADQLFIAGHSAGGTVATLTALTTDRFLALASFSGSMNQQGVGDWDPDLVVYDDTVEPEVMMRSPEAYAMSFKCAAKLYFGSEEEWFPGETERTAATARAAGHDVQAVKVPGDHFSSVQPAIMRSIHFFRQTAAAKGLRMPLPAGSIPDIPVPSRPVPGDFPPNIVPDIPRPSAPEFSPPDFSTPPVPPIPRPAVPTRPRSLSRHQGVVTFEFTDYTGTGPARFSARRALVRIRWADISRIEIDEAAGTISVAARKNMEVVTGPAKSALEDVGFVVGSTKFEPNPDSE